MKSNFIYSSILLVFSCLLLGCASKAKKGDWLTDSSSVYPSNTWITATGSGMSPQEASDQALSNLSRIFKADVSSERISRTSFNEYVNQNVRSFDELAGYEQNTRIQSNLQLLNTRILAQKSADGKYYALAGLNRFESEQVYSTEINKIASALTDDLTIFEEFTNTFDKLRLWKKMNTEIGLLEGLESQLRIISGRGNSFEDYQELTKKVDAIGAALRPKMTLHVKTDVPDIIKDAIISKYEKVGFTYNPNTTTPMLVLNVTYSQSKALVERLDAIFFNWNLTIKHLDPTDLNRFKTFSIRDRSGSTNEVNAKARLDMDIKRRLNEKLPSFIETELLQLSDF